MCKNADFRLFDKLVRMDCKKKDGGKDRKGGFSMKKGKILVVVLIGLLLIGGMVLIGCGNKCPDGGNCKYTEGSTSADDCRDACLRSQTSYGDDRNLYCNCN